MSQLSSMEWEGDIRDEVTLPLCIGGVEVWFHPLLISGMYGVKLSPSRYGVLTRCEQPWYPLNRKLGEPWAGLDPLPGSNHDPLGVQSAVYVNHV